MNSILNLIEGSSILLEDNMNEYMCIFNSSILEECSEQWKYNRNLNTDKIASICNTIKNKRILDTVLHFFYINDDEKERLICFDGNHRREALILLYKKYKLNINVCCYIYKNYQSNNIDKEIVEKFHIINQMSPIPDIYIDILDNIGQHSKLIYKRDIIESVFSIYKNKYKSFYSTKSKCRKPNFNDTSFKDFCNNLTFESKEELLKLLDISNKDKKTNISNNNKISKNIIAKCETQDFYLFI